MTVKNKKPQYRFVDIEVLMFLITKVYFAIPIALFSRITVTRTCPG